MDQQQQQPAEQPDEQVHPVRSGYATIGSAHVSRADVVAVAIDTEADRCVIYLRGGGSIALDSKFNADVLRLVQDN